MVIVPCNGCTACCYGSANLTEKEIESGLFKTMVHPDGRVGMATNKDRSCVYLAEGVGCAIHDRKPEHCQGFDCRNKDQYLPVKVIDAAKLLEVAE